MKVKEFIKLEEDIDVYDNVCEALAICFCGPLELTEEGKFHFDFALNMDIQIDDSGDIKTAAVDVDDEFFEDNWKFKLKKAQEFFYAAAGYCKSTDWDRWFVDNSHTVENSKLIL